MDRWIFYRRQISKWLNKKDSVLLVGASNEEAKIFLELNYEKLTLSYYDDEQKNGFLKLGFVEGENLFKIDIRSIPFEDNKFDYVFTHATIHHVDLPHLAITELYRVSQKGCLIIESNDSLVMRIASKLGFSENFEVSAIKNGTGGVLNSKIPNYVYRWTEREINKLFYSFKPEFIHKIAFSYYYDFQNSALENNSIKKIIKKLINIFLKIYFIFFPNQKNIVSFFISKDDKIKRFN